MNLVTVVSSHLRFVSVSELRGLIPFLKGVRRGPTRGADPSPGHTSNPFPTCRRAAPAKFLPSLLQCAGNRSGLSLCK